mmetsp:Transcript_31112/g.92598  ORF Transcript_31112/g.92598 Transcript_31112/m.92598 type:complete len:269 (-) Transcript_31112:646-1452(-)
MSSTFVQGSMNASMASSTTLVFAEVPPAGRSAPLRKFKTATATSNHHHVWPARTSPAARGPLLTPERRRFLAEDRCCAASCIAQRRAAPRPAAMSLVAKGSSSSSETSGASSVRPCMAAQSATSLHTSSVSPARSTSPVPLREAWRSSVWACVLRAHSRTLEKRGFRSSISRRKENWAKAAAASLLSRKTDGLEQHSVQLGSVPAFPSRFGCESRWNTLAGRSSTAPPARRKAPAAPPPAARSRSREAAAPSASRATVSGGASEKTQT